MCLLLVYHSFTTGCIQLLSCNLPVGECVMYIYFWILFNLLCLLIKIEFFFCCGTTFFILSVYWTQPIYIIPYIGDSCKVSQSGVILTLVPSFHISYSLYEIICNNHCFLNVELLSIIWNRSFFNIP